MADVLQREDEGHFGMNMEGCCPLKGRFKDIGFVRQTLDLRTLHTSLLIFPSDPPLNF